MPHFFGKKRFLPRKKFMILPFVESRHRQVRREAPTVTSHKEAENERQNEKMQQEDINIALEDIKQDKTELKIFMNEEMIRKKMQELLDKLPKSDKLRNLLDEDEEIDNINKYRTSLKVKKEPFR